MMKNWNDSGNLSAKLKILPESWVSQATADIRRMGKALNNANEEIRELRKQLKLGERGNRLRTLYLNDSPHLLMQFVTTSDRQLLVDLIAGQEEEGEINFPFRITKVGEDKATFDLDTILTLGCRTHGPFEITAGDHIGENEEKIAYGCPKCGDKKFIGETA